MNAYWVDGGGGKHRYKIIDWFNQPSCNDFTNFPGYSGLHLYSIEGGRSELFLSSQWATYNGYATIAFADGNTLDFVSFAPYQFATPNGNYLRNSTNGSKLPAQDTLGRTVTYTAGTIGSSSDTYQIVDSNGSTQTYSIRYKTISAWDPWRSSNNTQTLGADRTVIDFITLPNGKQWSFNYDHDQGFLTKVTLPTGATTEFGYYGGNTDHNAADDYVVSRKVNLGGTDKTWSYGRADATYRTITVTAPEGDVVVHTFEGTGEETSTQWKTSVSGSVLKTVSRSWTHDAVESNGQPKNARVLSTTTTLNSGLYSIHSVTYNSNGLVTADSVTDWASSSPPILTHSTKTYTTFSNYYLNWYRIASETLYGFNPATTTDAQQGKKEFFYDDYSVTFRGYSVPNNFAATSAANRGNLTRVRTYKDSSNYLESQMHYDNLGNLIETIDPLSHSTTVDFTDNFTDSTNRYTFAYPKKVTNALSQYATSKYDFNTGLIKEVTNIRGYTTTTVYDSMNRVTSISEPAVSGTSKVTTYAYDDTNRKTTKEVTVDTSGNKGHVETFFDKLYRTIKSVTNDPGGAITVETEYDENGRVKKTSNPYRSGGTVIWTQTAYDAMSRPVTVTAPDTSTVSYAYSNNVTTTTDQAGNQRRYTYNVLGQLSKVEEPNPTLSTPVPTYYYYYVFGPLYQSYQSGQTRTWAYNWLGQMTSQALPESGTTSFTYDGGGRLSTKTDARSIVTTMSYDNANRPTGRSYSDSTPAVSFTYDQSSQTGLRTAMSDGLGAVSYNYDAMDRLTSEARTLTGISGTFTTSYVYNVKGDVTQITYPSGRVVNLAYATDAGCCNSRLASIADGTTGATLLNSIAFNAAGGVTSQTLNPGSNAVTQTFTYDANRLQLTRIQAAKGSTTLMDFSYNYGSSSTNTGRVLSRTDAVQPEHSAGYVYDSLYRLSKAGGADSSWAIYWVFDAYGNRTSQTPLGLATSKAGSQTLGYSNNKNTSFTYDSAGNTTNDTAHTYAYNAENQQISMDGSAAAYAYDGEGRRMKKTVSGVSTYYFYGSGGLLCEFSTSTSDGSATAASSTDRTIYRTSEKTGTAVLLFNTSGIVIENNRALPYGEAWFSDVASANDKKFTTYDRDKESGLDYAMARLYANTGGRFTSPDAGPIRLKAPSSLNRYAYGAADPINLADPSGNMTVPAGFISIDTCYGLGGQPYLNGVYAFASSEAGAAGPDDLSCYFPEALLAFCPDVLLGYSSGGGYCITTEPEPIYEPPTFVEPPQPPTCFAELKYKPAFAQFGDATGATHAFWWVKDRAGDTFIISGGGAAQFNARVPVGLTVTVVPGNSNPPIGTGGVDSRADHAGQPTHWKASGPGPTCDAVDRMLAAARGFPNGKHPYTGVGFNSNTAARWVGLKGGFSPSAPPGAISWKLRLPF